MPHLGRVRAPYENEEGPVTPFHATVAPSRAWRGSRFQVDRATKKPATTCLDGLRDKVDWRLTENSAKPHGRGSWLSTSPKFLVSRSKRDFSHFRCTPRASAPRCAARSSRFPHFIDRNSRLARSTRAALRAPRSESRRRARVPPQPPSFSFLCPRIPW